MTKIPPIKIQGIKSKLIPTIKNILEKQDFTKKLWVEPFMGSAVVAFNMNPKKALLADTNPFLVQFYQDIQKKKITSQKVFDYLKKQAELLKKEPDYYYKVRKKFNEEHNSLDFLFLNRACFNGVMRFNKKKQFNTPFCKKPERFRKAYITKICNQVKHVEQSINSEWIFVEQPWQETLKEVNAQSFVYLDPPYVARHSDYFSQWGEEQAQELVDYIQTMDCQWLYSMWQENKYRKNPQIELFNSNKYALHSFDHFYHVGGQETTRNKMIEALIFKK